MKEKFINISLGLSVISWSFLGFWHTDFSELTVVRAVSSSLNLLIGALIITRKPVVKEGSLNSILKCVPSFILGGVLFKLAHPFGGFTLTLNVLFTAGSLLAIISFISLGRNFAIFPNLRSIVNKGPYSLIRHPGYLGEAMMVTACFLSKITILSAAALAGFLFSIGYRILEEEKLLSKTNTYTLYKLKVKWKLVPYVW